MLSSISSGFDKTQPSESVRERPRASERSAEKRGARGLKPRPGFSNGANSPHGHFRLPDERPDTETGSRHLADGTFIHPLLVSLGRSCLADAVNHGFGGMIEMQLRFLVLALLHTRFD